MTDLSMDQGKVDLWERGFMFAIQDIDPKYGEVSAHLVKWGESRDKKEKVPIKLVDCKELL